MRACQFRVANSPQKGVLFTSVAGVNKRAKIQAAAHTRALRKSRMARQRGHWRAHPAHQNLGSPDRPGLRTGDRRLQELELDHAKEKHVTLTLHLCTPNPKTSD